MLVRNRNALSAIHILHFSEHVSIEFILALDAKDFRWRERTFSQSISSFDIVARVDQETLALKHIVIFSKFFFRTFGMDSDCHLSTTLIWKQFDATRNSCQHRRIARNASFEDFSHTGESTDDVCGSSRSLWSERDSLTCFDDLSVLDFDVCLGWKMVEIENLAGFVFNRQARMLFTLVLDDNHFILVCLALNTNCFAFLNISEVNCSTLFSKNR